MPAEDIRVETRYVDGGSALNTLIQRNPCKVYWLSLFPQTVATIGVLKLYDGFDAGGKLRWQMEIGVVKGFLFSPSISCDEGLFIESDANIGGYTVAYRLIGKKEN